MWRGHSLQRALPKQRPRGAKAARFQSAEQLKPRVLAGHARSLLEACSLGSQHILNNPTNKHKVINNGSVTKTQSKEAFRANNRALIYPGPEVCVQS